MAKLSHGSYSWRAEGLAEKYKAIEALDKPAKRKTTKKDTRTWCRGKKGVEHELHRWFEHSYWNGGRRRMKQYVKCTCRNCGKEFWGRRKDSSVPLVIEIDESNDNVPYPVQVKVNGRAIPMDPRRFGTHYFCWACAEWHPKY